MYSHFTVRSQRRVCKQSIDAWFAGYNRTSQPLIFHSKINQFFLLFHCMGKWMISKMQQSPDCMPLENHTTVPFCSSELRNLYLISMFVTLTFGVRCESLCEFFETVDSSSSPSSSSSSSSASSCIFCSSWEARLWLTPWRGVNF